MTDFDNTSRGALFKNTRKEKETHPDYTGNINIAGVEHWLSAWLKTSQKGEKYFSISIGDVKKQQTSCAEIQPMQKSDEFSDPIPF